MTENVAPAPPGRAVAAIAVLGLAVALAVLPALLGFGVAPRPVLQAAASLAGLVAVVGGVKLAAMCSGMAAGRLPPPSIDRAVVDRARTVCAGKEVISMRKLLYAAILATSALTALAATVSASGIPPCC